MVSFELTEEEKMVQQVAHDFAKKEIRPVAAYYDEHEEVPYDIIKKAAAIGFGVSKQGSLLEGSG
ncbi:MAG TPA: acyl-CoA dehydrogenase family protein, partial [Tepidiformaceae bacterium]|nr:acyl-CoA dehydrogenase family protein [Tepidiformaceae bacterium]